MQTPSPKQITKTYQDADEFLRDRPIMERQGWKVVKEVEQWKPPFNVFVTFQRPDDPIKQSQSQQSQPTRGPLRYPTGSVPESRQPFPPLGEKPSRSTLKPGQAQKPPSATPAVSRTKLQPEPLEVKDDVSFTPSRETQELGSPEKIHQEQATFRERNHIRAEKTRRWLATKSRGFRIAYYIATFALCLSICGLCSYAAYAILREAAMSDSSSNVSATAQPVVVQVPKATPTAHPKPTPSPKPSPKPRPKRKSKPKQSRQPASAPTVSITFTCASAVDYSYGHVCIQTQSGAALTISVVYCSGYKATSDSLQGTVYADGSGAYEWNWTPETECRGQATAYVNASWNGHQSSNADTFDVQ